MDVDDAIAVAGDDGGGHQLEVAGQDEEVHPVALQAREPAAASAGSASTSAGTPCERGALQRPRIGSVAQDQHHPRRGLRPERAQQRLEIAAAPRDGHGHAHRHGGGK